jgi:hypothetical protein
MIIRQPVYWQTFLLAEGWMNVAFINRESVSYWRPLSLISGALFHL